jgi:hypothetical protein
MDKDKIKTIFGFLELLGDNNSSNKEKATHSSMGGSKIKIVVYQRGWIAIGSYSEEGDVCILENAHIIRRWGTDNGLGQLALEGPQEETKLDKTGVIRALRQTTVNIIDCDESKWKSL